jgi:hypothetical protein
VVVLGRAAVVDVPTALVAAGTLGVRLLLPRAPEPLLVAVAAAFGLMVR